MRAILAAALLACATGAHAASFDEKLATCLACHGEKGISETSEVPSLAGMPADCTPSSLEIRMSLSVILLQIGASGFEPPTPRPPVWCANQAALRPDPLRGRRSSFEGRGGT